MALNEETLKSIIKSQLDEVTMDFPVVDDEGNLSNSIINPFKDGTPTMTDGDGNDVRGLDAIVNSISEKVISHFVENTETSLLDRFDKLESDFDSFVQAMLGVGVGPSTAVPAGVTAWLTTSNTVTRVTDKASAELAEKPYIFGSKS